MKTKIFRPPSIRLASPFLLNFDFDNFPCLTSFMYQSKSCKKGPLINVSLGSSENKMADELSFKNNEGEYYITFFCA